MNKWQKILTVVALIAFSAIIAEAKIGDTQDQVIRFAQKQEDIARIDSKWYGGHAAIDVVYTDTTKLTHIFGGNGREIEQYIYAPKRYTDAQIKSIQHLYHTSWRGLGVKDGMFSWASASNLLMMAARYPNGDMVLIWDYNRIGEINVIEGSAQKAVVEVPQQAPLGPNVAQQPGTPDEGLKPSQVTPQIAPVAASNPAPTLQPVPIVAPQSAPPNADIGNGPTDCYLRAAKIYGYLKGSCYWLEVAGVRITDKTTGVTFGHAVVFSQLTPSSKVVMSDYNGGLDLETKSHELAQLSVAAAAATQNSNGPYTVQSIQGWITE